jgi:hypothetical protein
VAIAAVVQVSVHPLHFHSSNPFSGFEEKKREKKKEKREKKKEKLQNFLASVAGSSMDRSSAAEATAPKPRRLLSAQAAEAPPWV